MASSTFKPGDRVRIFWPSRKQPTAGRVVRCVGAFVSVRVDDPRMLSRFGASPDPSNPECILFGGLWLCDAEKLDGLFDI